MRKKTLWELVNEKLKTELSETQYKLFKNVKGGDVEPDHILRLFCPNEVIASIIKKSFDPKLKRILADLGYPMITIKYHVKNDGEFKEEKTTRGVSVKHERGTNHYGLNGVYTFDNFVPGKNSEMAFSAAMAVAHAPGEEYNPLFIYGGVGLGKTHLLHAIGNDIIKRKRKMKVLLITTEELISKIVESLQKRKMNEFRNKIRSFDVLLIDDIHFLSGADFSQEALFHIFNSFYNEKKQVVFTADRPPWEMENIAERLVDRFSWGLVTDIKPPEYETRLAILKLKAEEKGLDLPDEVLELIAKNVKKNVRLLESCVVKLHAIHSLQRIPITVSMAKKYLNDIFSSASLNEPEDIVRVVSEYYNIPKTEIMGKKQKREHVHARQICMFLMKNIYNMQVVEIAKFFGKDHTTVLHAINKIEKKISEKENLKEEVMEIEKMLKRM